PMSMSEIFQRANTLLFVRAGAFMAIEAVVISPSLLLEIALPLASVKSATFVPMLPMILLGPFGAAAMLHVITQEYLDQTVSIGDAFRFALNRFLPLFGTNLLAGLGIVFGLMCCVPGIYLWVIWAFVSQIVVMENLSGSTALSRSKGLVQGYFWNVFGVLFLV